MKLVSLNIWGGIQGQPLFDYILEQSKTTDIFCFQEVFNSDLTQTPEGFLGVVNLFSRLKDLLPGYTGYFEVFSSNHDVGKPVDLPVDSGNAMFIKNNLGAGVLNSIEIYPDKEENNNPSLYNLRTVLQRAELQINGKSLQIYNYHGIPYPGDKQDSPERIEQSKKIAEVLSGQNAEKILCGDFNLTVGTQSVALLAVDMRDLIEEYKIENTRNEISWKQYNNKQYFADFTFVSPGVKVKNFEVPYNLVSDHLPMILEFEL